MGERARFFALAWRRYAGILCVSMFSPRVTDRIWATLCALAAFLLFLAFWGPPSWTAAFPQGMVFRFLDALWCDVFALALACVPSFLGVGKRRASRASLIVGCAYLPVFCALVILAKPINELDSLIGVFALIDLCALFAAAALRLVAARRNRGRLAGPDLLRVVWAFVTPIAWFAFFIVGLRSSSLWPIFRAVGALSLLVPAVAILTERVPVTVGISADDLKRRFSISARETEVLGSLQDGLTNQEIADRLFVSITTVKSHLSHLYEKTGTRNRVELLRIIRSDEGESDLRVMENSRVPGSS